MTRPIRLPEHERQKLELERLKLEQERLKLVVDIWKHGVSVQMHFNDIEMRVRNLYYTLLAASLALVGVVEGKKIQIPLGETQVSLTLVVVAAIIPISMLFYFMDRHWYHRLLKGAVNQCIEIEAKYANKLPEIQFGKKIAEESPVNFSGIWKWIFFFIRDDKFRKNGRIHSDQKIEILYKSVIWGCAFIVLAYGLVSGVRFYGCAPWQHLAGSCIVATQKQPAAMATETNQTKANPLPQTSPSDDSGKSSDAGMSVPDGQDSTLEGSGTAVELSKESSGKAEPGTNE